MAYEERLTFPSSAHGADDADIDVWSWCDDDRDEPRAIVGVRFNIGAYETGSGKYLPGATVTMHARDARALGHMLTEAASIAALEAMLGTDED